MDIRKLQKIAVAALEDIKAKDIEVINTSKISAMFDRVIIATGDSNRHVKSLAKNVHQRALRAVPAAQALQRRDGVARGRAVCRGQDFARIDAEPGHAGQCALDHGQPMRRGALRRGTQGRGTGRDQAQRGQAEGFARLEGKPQVRHVQRIEGAAEQPEHARADLTHRAGPAAARPVRPA